MAIRKFCNLTLVLLVLLLCWTALSMAESRKVNITWKMATNVPEGMTLTKFFNNKVSETLEGLTGGNASFNWYHGGIMGDDEDWISKMHIDQLQGAALDSSGVDIAVPAMGIMQLPFLFESHEEVVHTRDILRQKLCNLFEERGYRVLMFGVQPFDDLYSTKRQLRMPEDFTKSKFAAYTGIVVQESFNALGANQIPISVPEIVSSMRAGICNGLLAPAVWYVGSQLYTITKYMTPSNMRCTVAGVVVTTKTWNGFPEKYRAPVEKAMLELDHELDNTMEILNEKCFKAMAKYGVKKIKLSPDEIEVLKRQTRPVLNNLAGKVYTRELLDDIQRILDEYRSRDAYNQDTNVIALLSSNAIEEAKKKRLILKNGIIRKNKRFEEIDKRRQWWWVAENRMSKSLDY
ncbi:MAG: TRAP transporter substrate-binding protein DctP [Thermodesulfobacteriota bacterium]|nr:TRAP transporter substrate-binding protein DctP [Thermodesulfobacteriota bacterium]